MRRGLAGLLFFIAAVGLALAAGGWYLQRVAFDTAHSGDLARVVLRDDAIRAQIATAAGAATAQTLGVSPEQIQAQVDTLARSDAGADLMRQIITDAHAKLIGERAAPVEITGPQLVAADPQRGSRLPAAGGAARRGGRRAEHDPRGAALGGADRRHRRRPSPSSSA